jgi:UDP:flavonoid glycosyltransferase YjiC (YdhE family)
MPREDAIETITTMTVQKPLVLLCAHGATGHFMPVLTIAAEMVVRGLEVTFVTATARKERVEAVGARFIPIQGELADVTNTEAVIEKIAPLRNSIAPGPLQVAYDMEVFFVNPIEGQYAALQTALKILTKEHPGRPIILGYEALYMGAIPLVLDGPGIKPTASFGIGAMPVLLSSIDTAPFGPGLPPDSSPEGRTRNIAMNKEVMEGMFAKPNALFHETLREMGIKSSLPFFLDAPYHVGNRFLQMCIPSVEYPRSDVPPTLQFAGCCPKHQRDAFMHAPSWWAEITQKESKTIVFVSQGTVSPDHTNLIIPTIQALEDRSDIIVIAALGRKGATIGGGTVIPKNARVFDWIPYDEVLPHAKVFVTNGGYGSLQHAVSNMTPMVIAGAGEDKPEVAARAEWAGMAVNLRTGTPSPEQVREAVDRILGDPKYERRCHELGNEAKTYNTFDIVQKTIEDLAAGK